jgi:hypothetical protein
VPELQDRAVERVNDHLDRVSRALDDDAVSPQITGEGITDGLEGRGMVT